MPIKNTKTPTHTHAHPRTTPRKRKTTGKVVSVTERTRSTADECRSNPVDIGTSEVRCNPAPTSETPEGSTSVLEIRKTPRPRTTAPSGDLAAAAAEAAPNAARLSRTPSPTAPYATACTADGDSNDGSDDRASRPLYRCRVAMLVGGAAAPTRRLVTYAPALNTAPELSTTTAELV